MDATEEPGERRPIKYGRVYGKGEAGLYESRRLSAVVRALDESGGYGRFFVVASEGSLSNKCEVPKGPWKLEDERTHSPRAYQGFGDLFGCGSQGV